MNKTDLVLNVKEYIFNLVIKSLEITNIYKKNFISFTTTLVFYVYAVVFIYGQIINLFLNFRVFEKITSTRSKIKSK